MEKKMVRVHKAKERSAPVGMFKNRIVFQFCDA